MKRRLLNKTKMLQQEAGWLLNHRDDNKILIGFHHKKKVFQTLLNSYGEIQALNPNRLLIKADNIGWTFFRRLFGRTVFILKEDIEEVFLNRYIVIKNGGVYDLELDYFFPRKRFFKLKRLYEHKLVDKDLNLIDLKLAGDSPRRWSYEYAKERSRFINQLLHKRKRYNSNNLNVSKYIDENMYNFDPFAYEGDDNE